MTKPNSKPKAPGHLRKSTQRWWLEVFETYELEIHHIQLLTKACEAHDLGEAAREAIAEKGLTFESRFGPKARPEVNIERDCRRSFASIIREIGLDLSPT